VSAPTGGWLWGTVREVERHGPGVILRLDAPGRTPHLPGQHYVIRLTAEDGYTASRSYSVVSSPSQELLEFYIQRLNDGEVSGYLAEVVEPGDELELRGPIGGWFVWGGDVAALAIGGGSGVAPLVSMLRHARHLDRTDLLTLAVAARTLDELPYADEFADAGAMIALSRARYAGRIARRLDAADLVPLLGNARVHYVCGSAAFAETLSTALVAVGVPPEAVRVERFGPSGG